MIHTHNVCKTYLMGDTEIRALDHVSLSVDDGKFVAVRGKSGSGKSTLLHILGGLDSPDSGMVFIGEKDIAKMQEKELAVFRRRHIGFVFQFFNLLPELTLLENVLFPAKIDKTVPDPDYLDYILETLELSDRFHHLPAQLSGGQMQRTAIARALILKPELLLLDEPTGNLDEESAGKVIAMLSTLHKETDTTILLVTHDADVAAAADCSVVIRDGVLSYE